MTAPAHQDQEHRGLQAVVNPGFGQGPAIVTRNYAQLGMTNVPLYQSHGVASKSFIELAGPAAEGRAPAAAALLVAEKLPDTDPQKKVVVDYKQTYEKATGSRSRPWGHALRRPVHARRGDEARQRH
jgi:branched-chain amino acid transport system substrate-binding protein